jgi:hypothetical protein
MSFRDKLIVAESFEVRSNCNSCDLMDGSAGGSVVTPALRLVYKLLPSGENSAPYSVGGALPKSMTFLLEIAPVESAKSYIST